MLTNVIAYLHTTLAYQSAAMHLMVGQANFEAQQLHLNETLPIVVTANTNDWRVAMPPDGVAGTVITSNYLYRFTGGKLVSIQRRPPFRGAAGAAETQPPLTDTNAVYQLARQWLAAVSVDVPALEARCSHQVLLNAARSSAAGERRHPQPGVHARPTATNNPVRASVHGSGPALFRVAWRQSAPEVEMQIAGATRECVDLHIYNPAIIMAPPLQITNAAALLGPPPAPSHFVQEFFGGKTPYDTVAQPDRVFGWLLGSQPDTPDSRTNRSSAVAVDASTAAGLSQTLTAFDSYSWLETGGCEPDYGVNLRFIKGPDVVDIQWCFKCDHVQVLYNGNSAEKDCPAARVALVRTVQSLFPSDAIIRGLSLRNPNQ